MVGGGWCKVIIVSNPTAVEVVLSCIEVVVGVLTIIIEIVLIRKFRFGHKIYDEGIFLSISY